MDNAGCAPELDRDDGRGEVGLNEDAEAVGKLADFDVGIADEGTFGTHGNSGEEEIVQSTLSAAAHEQNVARL